MLKNIPYSGLSARAYVKNCTPNRPNRTLIAVSIACALSSQYAWIAQAQESTSPDAVVSAARTTQAVTDALPSTTVITRADIDSATVGDVVGLLRQQVGLNVRQNGTAGSISGVSIRGGELRHTLILVDGVPLNDVSLGLSPLEQIPLNVIERIEVVRGNVSALYGSQATGGLVQIFTRKPLSGHGVDIRLGIGDKGQRQASAQVSVGGANVQWTLGASHNRVEAISAQNGPLANPDQDGYRNNAVNMSVRATPTDTTELGARFFQSNGRSDYDERSAYDANFMPVADVSKQYNKTRVQSASVYANQQWNDTLSSSLNVSQLSNTSDSFASYFSHYKTRNQQVSLQNQWNSSIGTWVLGLSHAHQVLDSSNYFGKKRNTESAWLGYQRDSNRHHLQVNGRFDDVSDLNEASILTGAIHYGYDLSPACRLLAGYSNGFTAPGFDYLYYPYFSNPNLKAEKASYAQMGAQWVRNNLGARVTYFDTRYRDKIANDANWIPQNIARARAQGVETHAWFDVLGWKLDAGLTYQEVRDRADDTILDRQPRWIGNMTLNKTWGKWQTQLAWQARSDITDSLSYGGRAAGYGVLNAGIHYQLQKDLQLALNVGNVFDRRYEPLAGYNAMPRNFLLSVNYKPSW